MGFLVEDIGPEVTEEEAAQRLCANRQWTVRIAITVAGIGVLMGYGVFYPGRSWKMVGIAAVALAITLPVAWVAMWLVLKPALFLTGVRTARHVGRPVQVLTRPALALLGLVLLAMTLVGLYFAATTPV